MSDPQILLPKVHPEAKVVVVEVSPEARVVVSVAVLSIFGGSAGCAGI